MMDLPPPPASAFECVIPSANTSAQRTRASLQVVAEKHLETMDDQELDANWKLDDFFGTIAVINLPHATERLEKITEELASIGTDSFFLFPAIYGRTEVKKHIWKKFTSSKRLERLKRQNGKGHQEIMKHAWQGEAGCYMSHYKLLEYVRDSFEAAKHDLQHAIEEQNEEAIKEAQERINKFSSVLVIEDDAGFGVLNLENEQIIRKGIGKHLRQAMKELPENWDLLYLLCRPPPRVKATKKISPCIYRITQNRTGLCYAVNHTIYDYLINYLKKVENPLVKRISPVDSAIGKVNRHYNAYAIFPSIVYAPGGESFIDGFNRPWHRQWHAANLSKYYFKNNHTEPSL